MLTYRDVLTDENPYLSILQTYTEIDKEVSMVALPESSKEFGNVYLDHEMKISRLVEKPSDDQANYVFAGIFVLFPKIFELLDMYNLSGKKIAETVRQLLAQNGEKEEKKE